MTTETWFGYTSALGLVLEGMSVSNADGKSLDPDVGFEQWRERTIKLREARGTLFLIGNGASASMASHFGADVAKNANIATQVFSDLSLMTAMSNDIAYDQDYAQPLRIYAKTGDMLVAISSSGKSPNIISAAKLASELQLSLITLTGLGEDNPLRKMGTLNFYVSANEHGMTETSHAAILHRWMDSVEI